MATARVQVSLDRRSAFPADVVTNTMHFTSALGDFVDATAAGELADAIDAFYLAFDERLGAPLAGTGTIAVYDMAEAEPRVPVLERAITPLTVGVNSLPSEVAMCLSFRADIASGDNARRRRGRIYVGPLITGWSVVSAPLNEPRPLTTYQDQVMNAAAANLSPVTGTSGMTLCVFSEADFSGGDPDLAAYPVVEYWMDDAFDTQRRRGPAPTTRRVVAA